VAAGCIVCAFFFLEISMKILYSRQLQVKGLIYNSPSEIPTTWGDLGPSIFLVGPTPRDPVTPSWRPKALALIKSYGFKGTVIVPEDIPGSLDIWTTESAISPQEKAKVIEAQIIWEWWAIASSTCIAAWIPREASFKKSVPVSAYNDPMRALKMIELNLMGPMPAFTTNIEVGQIIQSERLAPRLIVGTPPEAQHMGYILTMCKSNALRANLFGCSYTQEIPLTSTMEDLLQQAVQRA
jgi:hypothetical protein